MSTRRKLKEEFINIPDQKMAPHARSRRVIVQLADVAWDQVAVLRHCHSQG